MDDIPDEINTSMEESDKDADKEVGGMMFEFLSESLSSAYQYYNMC